MNGTARSPYDCLIIGGGIVGAACAAVLARGGQNVLLLERERQWGTHTSSRNSGVIHAGIYSPPGSLKSELCVRGRHLLYERCATRGVPHQKLGKLIVATEEREHIELERLQTLATENGAPATLISADEVRRMEPRLRAHSALWSPETGIVDVDALLRDYVREAKDHGATVALRTSVTALTKERGTWQVSTRGDGAEDTTVVVARSVVNAAGHRAEEIARLAGEHTPRYATCFSKGQYFVLSRRPELMVSHLVYPVPSPGYLGIHLTLDLGGTLLLGPDATEVNTIDYSVDETRRTAFVEVARRYLPHLLPQDLTPGYAGIRPKLRPEGHAFRDFLIEESSEPELAGLFHLLGIESPGLTASEAIAERVHSLVG